MRPAGPKRKLGPKHIYVNLTYTNYSAVRTCAAEMGYVATDSTRKNILFWCDQAASAEFMSRLFPWQLYNHFPGMWAIARKVDMIRNLERMQRLLPKLYNFFPRSFIIPGNHQDFRSYMARREKITTFVIKPDRGSLGRGIILVQDPDVVSAYSDLAIAQKYVKPFLVDGLKFDLRIYALVTSVDPLRVYIHREGLARFCTEPYEDPNPGNLENVYSHLTNYSLNKKNENFDASNTKGHKRPMSMIFAEVERQGFDLNALKHQIEEIIRMTIVSILPFLANNYRAAVVVNDGKSRCFELLGFGILLDKKARPWLLEVNFMPMLDIDTEFDKELKFVVIKGIFAILGLSPKFKSTVIKRQKAETEKRIKGVTSLPMQQIFDPSVESQTAAEATNWRQLYPVLEDDTSEIERALTAVKTITFASIENGAFRARQKAVLSQLQEIKQRESSAQWKPRIGRVLASLPPRKIKTPPPEKLPLVIAPEPQVVEPEKPTPDPVPPPQRRFVRDLLKPASIVQFPGFIPELIVKEEEDARLLVLANRVALMRAAGLDRAVLSRFGMAQKSDGATASCNSLLRMKPSVVVARPIIKLPVSIHQLA
jgi:tubulin polyglutamylase TTLL6/13